MLSVVILSLILITGLVVFAILFSNRVNRTLQTTLTEARMGQMQQLSVLEKSVHQGMLTGLDKTHVAINAMTERLAGLNQTQVELKDLSKLFVDLKNVLDNKQARGSFGEWQLSAILHDGLPQCAYQLQASHLNNRVDALLTIKDTLIPIDSKFPLEHYARFLESEAEQDLKAFKADVRVHIKAIRDKYIDGTTPFGALMFIPSESVFHFIQKEATDIVMLAHKNKVHLVSPTTLLAVLSMISRFIRDDKLSSEVQLVQEHMARLAEDFGRFETRFSALAKHHNQVTGDMEALDTSAQKIIKRFDEISKINISTETTD